MKNSSKQEHLFEIEVFCNIIHFLTVTFDQYNAILLNNSINFLKGLAEPKLLNEKKMNYSVWHEMLNFITKCSFTFNTI